MNRIAMKTLLSALGIFGALAAGYGWLAAQEPAPAARDLELRPDDTITWTPSGVHRVRFGGTFMRKHPVTGVETEVKLTDFSAVEKVLEITLDPPTPALVVDAQRVVATAAANQKVRAKVKPDAAAGGVVEFLFTCGFTPHVPLMVTDSFKIGPARRDIEIVSANPPPYLRWLLKTAQGNRDLTKP